MRTIITALALGLATLLPALGWGKTLPVGPGDSIQQAIDAAADGDTVAVAPGSYLENLDFNGKAIAVVGAGPATIVRGLGTDSVVRFASGEGRDSVLDSLTITGGNALQGGGIAILDSSPTIIRTVITENRARAAGSGVFIDGSVNGAAPALRNNLITFNTTSGGDPHSLQIRNARPLVVNNTIYGGDSNGVHLSGAAADTVLMNNVIAENGIPDRAGRRGRGICDFSAGAITRYNVFWRNRIAALLTKGRDFKSIRSAERLLGLPGLAGNSDRSPNFQNRHTRRGPVDLRLRGSSRIRNTGNPDRAFADRDGTRNDPGYTGGPFASSPSR